MNITTYKSLLTGKRTWLVASKGKCGYDGYVVYTIQLYQGQWQCYKTDGYNLDLIKTYEGSGNFLLSSDLTNDKKE